MATNELVGAVTTVFTPPASCLQVITSGSDQEVFETSTSLFLGNFNGQYAGENYLDKATDCYPTPTSKINYWANYYYSPAYCPSGYSTACSYTAGNPPLATGATAWLCCPSGFDCVKGWAHGCHRLTSGILSNIFVATARTATLDTANPLVTISLSEPQYIWNDGIPVAWQKTDTDILALIAQQMASEVTRPSTAHFTSTPILTTLPSDLLSRLSVSTSSPSSSTNESTHSLSTGAKTGIAIATTLFAIILFLCAALFFMSRRKTAKKHGQVLIYEKGGDGAERYAYRSELEVPPAELAGDNYMAELEDQRKGTWGGREEAREVFVRGT